MTALPARGQFWGYLVAGGLAALANYASRFVFSTWVPFEAAVTLAFGVGLCTGFVLMRSFAFRGGTRSTASQALWYVAINGVALVLTVAVSAAMLHIVWPAFGVHRYAEALAHAVGIGVPVLTSYFGHKWLTFR